MSLYTDFFYSQEFFGGDIDGNPPGGPNKLNAYQNNIGSVILYWGLDPCTPVLSEFTWTVETDLVDTFDSSDKRIYESSESVTVPVGVDLKAIDFDGPIVSGDTFTATVNGTPVSVPFNSTSDTTLGDIASEAAYQTLSINRQLISGNTISIKVDAVTVSTLFATDSNATLAAFAAAIEAEPGVKSAAVIDAGPLTNDDRTIIIVPASGAAPMVLTDPSVIGTDPRPLISTEKNVDSAIVTSVPATTDDDRRIVITSSQGKTTQIVGPVLSGSASPSGVSVVSIKNTIKGRINKGVVVPSYQRLQDESEVMHWRVRASRVGTSTQYAYSEFSLTPAIDEVTRDEMLNILPDILYNKSPGGNIFGVHDSHGKYLDVHHREVSLTDRDLSTNLVRDTKVYPNYGSMAEIIKPAVMEYIDYREIIKTFLRQARNSPTLRSIIDVAIASVCNPPTVTNIKDILTFFISDPSSSPPVEPSFIDDPSSYQKIIFSDSLVTGNSYSITIDGTPVVTAFDTYGDSDSAMLGIAANMAGEASVDSVSVVDAGAGLDRVLLVKASDPSIPPVLTDSEVTGGASQASTDITILETIDGPILWNNQDLGFGVIVDLLDNMESKTGVSFMRNIFKKLAPAHIPLYVRISTS
jgi:hypothetical protein